MPVIKKTILAQLVFFVSIANAQPKDVVFDLDETLIYSVSNQLGEGPQIIRWISENDGQKMQKTFQLATGTAELLQALSLQKDVRVSFYSAGMPDRNQFVLEQIKLPDGRSAKEIAYKILSAEDLELDSENLELKKSLKKHFSTDTGIENVLIVDDSKSYIKSTEKRNQIVVDITEDKSGDLKKVAAYLFLSLKEAKDSKTSLVEAYQKISRQMTDITALNSVGSSLLEASKTCNGRISLSL